MKKKTFIILLILFLLILSGCGNGKKDKRNTGASVEVIKTVEPVDNQLNCSKDITDQLSNLATNIRLVNYLEMSFSKEKLQEYSIIYDVTFGDSYDSQSIDGVVARLEENFLDLYNVGNDKVIISTKEIAPKRYNIKTYIGFKELTNEEKEKIGMTNIGSYEANLRAFENVGYICQSSI